jgi:hypothetical protein
MSTNRNRGVGTPGPDGADIWPVGKHEDGNAKAALVSRLAMSLALAPVGTAKAWRQNAAYQAFNARRNAATIDEALEANAFLKLHLITLGLEVDSPGTPPDPGVVAKLADANKEEALDVIVTMAETSGMTVEAARVKVLTERRRLHALRRR